MTAGRQQWVSSMRADNKCRTQTPIFAFPTLEYQILPLYKRAYTWIHIAG